MRTVSDRPEQLTPELIRQRVQVTYQEDGGTVTAYTDSDGEICSTVYQRYPGISLIHKDVHRPNFISNWRHNPREVLNIEHCREGRIECSMGENMLYLAPGDIAVFRTDYAVQEKLYPLNHYLHPSFAASDVKEGCTWRGPPIRPKRIKIRPLGVFNFGRIWYNDS